MSEPVDPDAELLDHLRRVLDRADPVPGEVTEFAKAALGWRRLDAELAELLEDSALEAGTLAGTRGTGAARWLGFRADGLSIDVELRRDGAKVVLLGQVEPPVAGATVELQRFGGEAVATTEADQLGRFRFELELSGRVRLRVLQEARAPVETSWFSL